MKIHAVIPAGVVVLRMLIVIAVPDCVQLLSSSRSASLNLLDQFSDGLDRPVNFRLVGDEKTYQAETILDPISGKWLALFWVPTGDYMLYEDTPGGYSSSISGGVPVTVTGFGALDGIVIGLPTDQRLPEPYVVINTPTPPGGNPPGDEYTPPTNTYTPPVEVTPTPTEVTPAPTEVLPLPLKWFPLRRR